MGKTDFKSPSGDYEVSGAFIKPVISAFSIKFLSEDLLKRYGLFPLEDEKWYPLQGYLSLLERVHDRMFVMLEAIGRNFFKDVIETGQASVEEVFEKINEHYQGYHRSSKGEKTDVGRYTYRKIKDNEYEIESSTVYPCSYEIGIIKGIVKNFGKTVIISHKDGRCRSKGDSVCVYKIKIH